MEGDDCTRVLIVDDHALTRGGLRQLLSDEPDIEVRWEANTPTEALDLATEHAPDLAIVDITLGGGTSGLDLVRRLCKLQPAPIVLVVSMHDEAIYAQRALSAGAQGYVMKRRPNKELVRAVHQVLEGRIYVSDNIKKRLLDRAFWDTDEEDSLVSRLSDRELEVFRLLGKGYSPRHIAEQLHLSVKTIGTHQHHMKQKLGVESSAELRLFAVAWHVEQSGK